MDFKIEEYWKIIINLKDVEKINNLKFFLENEKKENFINLKDVKFFFFLIF
jgi:hypothetical protein